MTETSKDMIKLVGQAIIFLMILVVLFSPDGMVMGTYDYLQYTEPLILQDALARAITTSSYSPDFFEIQIESTGKAHQLIIEKNEGIYSIHVIPSQKTEVKTKYMEADPFDLSTECTVQEVDTNLGEITEIYVTKRLTETGCKVKIDAGQVVIIETKQSVEEEI